MIGIAAFLKGLGPGPGPSTGRPREHTKEEVQRALEQSRGLVSVAAKILGCSRPTVYAYLDRYPELRSVAAEAREDLVDIAEAKFRDAVKRGEFKAVRLCLITLGKKRGYTVRTEVTGKDGDAVNVKVLSGVSM